MTPADPTSSPVQPAPDGNPVALPTDTTPTWEIELLISGALAFASLQLPGLFDGWFFALEPRLAESLDLAVVLAYVLAKSAATLLAITFSLHILLRGFWAAALGLHSVYPTGVLWDRVKTGPIFGRITREQVMPLPRFVARIDNIASVVFALGATLLLLTMLTGAMMLTSFGVSIGLSRLLERRIDPFVPFLLFGAVVLVPALIASQIDKRLGERLAPGSALARWIARFARLAGLGTQRLIGPMMLVFTTRMGQVKGTVALILAIYAIFGIVLVQLMIHLGVLSLDGYRFLSERGATVLSPSHYGDTRASQDLYSTLPFIPSETVSAGLLRVFVPYRIEQYDAAAERRCPEAVRAVTSADTTAAKAGRDSVVACLGRLLGPALDAVAVPDTRWVAATDAPSRLRGLVTYLPVGGLGDGPHVLSIARLPRRTALDAAERAGTAPAVERYEIPFWIDRSASAR